MKGNEIILKNDRRNLDAISTYQKKKRKGNGRYLIYFLMIQRL